jgi:hypothetical protein
LKEHRKTFEPISSILGLKHKWKNLCFSIAFYHFFVLLLECNRIRKGISKT